MRRALALLALSGTLLGAPASALAQSGGAPRVPAPPEPTPSAPRQQPSEAPAPRAAAPAEVDDDAPGWIVPAVIVVAALALLAALLRFTPLDPGRALRPAGRRLGDAGARTSEALAGLRDRARMGR